MQVVTQPGFVATRGDSYMRDVEGDDQPWLYRLSSFLAAGIPIAAPAWGINMVCGWFQPEMEMFGVKMMEHDTRYEYASEWVEIVLKLWTEQWFDYKGEFLTINQGFADPKPSQKPRPVLISAGSSP